jgi:hypothetical protein
VNLAEIWRGLEAAAPKHRQGRMEQRILGESAVDLFATLEVSLAPAGTRRGLELVIARELTADLELSAGTRLVDVRVEPRDGESAVVLSLEERGAEELFAAMCVDVARVTAAAHDPGAAVAAYLGRFERWRTMLQGTGRGLSGPQQRGLYGELLTLLDPLAVVIGIDEAIGAWLGPDGAPRDFEVANVGIEVKTTATTEPQVAIINGERQLDDRGLRALTLIHHSVEIVRDGLDTLPSLVSRVRREAVGHPQAATLEDRLIQSGYNDAHEPFYRRTGYLLRASVPFDVRDGFPRITETDLPNGIGGVRYTVAMAACTPFEVAMSSLSALLGSTR